MNGNFCSNGGAQLVNGGTCPYCGGNDQQQMNNQVPNNMNQGMMNNQMPTNMNQNMVMPNQPGMAGVENLNLNGNNPAVNKGTNTKGLVGLIFGIVDFFIFGFLAFVGLALSIIALNEANANGGAGKGVAIAGIVVCSIDSVLVLLNIILSVIGAAL